MRLFSQTSKLCLLTLLLVLVYGGDGQGDNQSWVLKGGLPERCGKENSIKNAAQCGRRFIGNFGVTNPVHLGRSPAGIADSKSAADYIDVEKYLNDVTRIVGGHQAIPGELPWQGRLHLLYGHHNKKGYNYNTPWCGAIIISEYWLLTAAHCVTDFTGTPKFRVHVGDHDTTKTDRGEETFYIDNLIIHEGYKIGSEDNDIALIRIQPKEYGRGIIFSKTVQPVCLPRPQTEFQPGTRCLVSGWGSHFQIEPERSKSPVSLKGYFKNQAILQKAEIRIIDDYTCSRSYTSLTKNMICAGYMAGEIDSCQGDSGGPLVCNVGNVYTLCGIVSWGGGCAWPGYPGVYVRVTEFIPWIYSKINSERENSSTGS